MTALSDLLNNAKGDRGLDTIVRIAERKGYKIDRSTFHRAFNGDHAKKPRDSTLRAWAAGLDLDVNELRRLCGLPEGEMGRYVGPDESARLNRDQRKALDRLIVTIVTPKESRDVEPAAQKKVTRITGGGAIPVEIRPRAKSRRPSSPDPSS